MTVNDEFLRALPKVDIHLHLVGSASPLTVAELAGRAPAGHPVPLEAEQIAAWYRFRDFAHFVQLYGQVSALVLTGDDITTLVRGLARDAAEQHIPYAEVTVTPLTHLAAGIHSADIADALERGRLEAAGMGVELGWIFDLAGELGLPAAEATLAFTLAYPHPGLVAFGIAGLETGVDRAAFAPTFRAAKDAGLRSVPHAGEGTGPEMIWTALRDLEADRIAHGISCLADDELVDYLREQQIPLDVCPSSNVATGVVPSFADHPLPRLLERGLFVTLNSDDPPMFGTNLTEEYRHLAGTLGMSRADLAGLARNGVRAAFCGDATKQALLAEIDAVEGRQDAVRGTSE